MSVDVHHMVMYGIKLPYLRIDYDEFEDVLYNNHSPTKYGEKIDLDKIYFLQDNYCSEYTVVGYIIDMADYHGFTGFVDTKITRSIDLMMELYEFLKQDGFDGVVPEEIPRPELLVFTYAH